MERNMEDKSALDWFEIPAADLARATRFYQKVLGRELRSDTMGSLKLSIFPYSQPGVGGCLIAGNGYAPGANGTVVYLPVETLDEALERAAHAGGKVALPRTALPEGMGYYAHIVDTEGNRVGLHAMA
jgi:predicted enzyme related to lactoylglutathione lyase